MDQTDKRLGSTHGAYVPQTQRDSNCSMSRNVDHGEALHMLASRNWVVIGDFESDIGSVANRVARRLRSVGKNVKAVQPQGLVRPRCGGDQSANQQVLYDTLEDAASGADTQPEVVLLAITPSQAKAGAIISQLIKLGIKQLYIQAHVLWELRNGWEVLREAADADVRIHEANILTELSKECGH